MTEQEIRTAALTAALEMGSQWTASSGRAQSLESTVGVADRFAEYIRTGQLGDPAPGTF